MTQFTNIVASKTGIKNIMEYPFLQTLEDNTLVTDEVGKVYLWSRGRYIDLTHLDNLIDRTGSIFMKVTKHVEHPSLPNNDALAVPFTFKLQKLNNNARLLDIKFHMYNPFDTEFRINQDMDPLRLFHVEDLVNKNGDVVVDRDIMETVIKWWSTMRQSTSLHFLSEKAQSNIQIGIDPEGVTFNFGFLQSGDSFEFHDTFLLIGDVKETVVELQ